MYSKQKAMIVKRFNKTLKTHMWHVFTRHGSYKWIDILQDLVDSYNQTKHSAIGMAPINVDPYDNALQHAQYVKTPDRVRFKFHVGDYVWISKVKGTFDKGYKPNWSEEVFTVAEQKKTVPPTYKLQDFDNIIINGSFYKPKLQKIEKPERYQVEWIVKTQTTKGGKKQYLVKWLGYPESSNSWVDNIEKW